MRKQIVLCCLLFLLSVTISPAAIVFKQTGDLKGIYVMDDNGTNVRLLTDQLNPSAPRWSPDGKQIVFSRGRNTQRKHLSIMNADGTNIRDITPPSNEKRDSHPSFSPDGKYIVFSRYEHKAPREPIDKRNSVMVMHLATGRFKKISNLGINRPEFSPNGKHIIFTTITVLGGEGSNVWIMEVDGADLRRLLPPPPEGDLSISRSTPRWSPEGQRIFYTEDHYTSAVVDGILHAFIPDGYYYFLCDKDGKNIKKLNIPKTLRHWGKSWIDDGKSIVFTAYEAVLNDPNIERAQTKMYKYHITSEKLTTLYVPPPDANVSQVDWISDDVLPVSPQGKRKVTWGTVKQ